MGSAGRFAAQLQALLGRRPAPAELDAFSKYLSLLLQWNRVYSLTAYHEAEQIRGKLFLDSLLFLQFIPDPECHVLDLGSGVGIPGIPLKITRPRLRMVLLEARRRRVSFLNTVVGSLGLRGISVIGARAAAVLNERPDLAGSFDIVVARAFGVVERAVPIAVKFLKAGGTFVASGPPVQKPRPLFEAESWRTVTSPISGRPRRFLVLVKKG